jgi:hypothetical protein
MTTVKLASQNIAAGAYVDLVPSTIFADPSLTPADVIVTVGIGYNLNGDPVELHGMKTYHPELTVVGYDLGKVRVFNTSNDTLPVEIILSKR